MVKITGGPRHDHRLTVLLTGIEDKQRGNLVLPLIYYFSLSLSLSFFPFFRAEVP